MSSFVPINNECVDCGVAVNPSSGRQEIVFDVAGRCRRRCGDCIAKLRRLPKSNTSGWMDPVKEEK